MSRSPAGTAQISPHRRHGLSGEGIGILRTGIKGRNRCSASQCENPVDISIKLVTRDLLTRGGKRISGLSYVSEPEIFSSTDRERETLKDLYDSILGTGAA